MLPSPYQRIGSYPPSNQSRNFLPSRSTLWLPANLYHSSPHPHHGTNSRPALPVSSLPLSSTKPVVHRPVLFPSDWIPNSCNNLSQHSHQPTSNQPLYVIVISLDFSKASDTVWHSTLMEKLAQLHLLDYVYNWLADFFTGHSHCTVYHGQASTLKSITASIIQGSGIRQAPYVVNASDLKMVTPGNQLCKFADDTYLVIPATNVVSRATEIDNIETWAQTNYLTLNRNKSKEIVSSDPRRRRQIETPPPTTDIARVT